MYCYKCGCELSAANQCPHCGTDVTRYKQIIQTSNVLYNQGLEKASVRDLTGAIASLKMSLWYSKDNLAARSLLGLIYYEIGESVAALSEWVIGKNINDERLHDPDYAGERYLTLLQKDRNGMENLQASIERYNHALDCCRVGSYDVAIIQLKKVLSLNPRYLRARQLLALLYMHERQWNRAIKELQKCLRLDLSNTTTLRYLQEAEEARGREHVREQTGRGKKKNDAEKDTQGGVIKYKAGNETIIQPTGLSIPGIDGFGIPAGALGALIGFIIGAAVISFFVLPKRVEAIRLASQEEVRTISTQMDSKDARIRTLEGQLRSLEGIMAVDEAGEAIDEASLTALLQTAAAYITAPEDIQNLTTLFAGVDHTRGGTTGNAAYDELYSILYTALSNDMLERYAWDGIGEYEQAVPDYRVVVYDLTLANCFEDAGNYSMTYVQRLYYLGDAIYRVYVSATGEEKRELYEELNKARIYLTRITEVFADTPYLEQAAERLQDVTQTLENDAMEMQEPAEGDTAQPGTTQQTTTAVPQTTTTVPQTTTTVPQTATTVPQTAGTAQQP